MPSTTQTDDNDSIISKNWVWVPNQPDLFTRGYISEYLPDGKCKVNIVKGQDSTSTSSTITIDQKSWRIVTLQNSTNVKTWQS